jgi:hypothetical protein
MIESCIQFCSSRPRSGSCAAPYATWLAGGDPVPGASRCFISVLNRNSKLENIAPCYSSNKLCGPIQGEVKNKTSRNQNRYCERHGMHTAGRPEVCPGVLVPIKIQKSRIKNLHLCSLSNTSCYPIHSEGLCRKIFQLFPPLVTPGTKFVTPIHYGMNVFSKNLCSYQPTDKACQLHTY